MKTRDLEQGDTWRLEFDESIVPDHPNPGWEQYIRNTCAWFKCTKTFRQNCKQCSIAPMEKPSITSENINVLLENLVEKIRIKCYHEDLGKEYRPFVNLDVKSPHEPDHCEACMAG
ncbi:hypothetical protein FQN60_012870, partial [Etheostoma spectabile]